MAPADVLLPNGTVVSCLQRHEVPIVYREVQSYFSNGLRLSPGDTVFDVGANIGLFSLEVYQRCHRDYPRAPVLSTAYPDEDADIEMAKEATLKNIMHFADAPLALRCLRWLPAGLRAPIVHYAIKRTLCSERVICQMR